MAREFISGNFASEGFVVAQVAANGGDIARVALPTPTMIPLSVSPDGSTLLVADEVGQAAIHGPLWSVPVLGGSARKLGDIDATSAEFSPDGQTIVYVSGNDLFLAKSDGSQSRKLVSLSDAVFDPVCSPDAKSITLPPRRRIQLGGLAFFLGRLGPMEEIRMRCCPVGTSLLPNAAADGHQMRTTSYFNLAPTYGRGRKKEAGLERPFRSQSS